MRSMPVRPSSETRSGFLSLLLLIGAVLVVPRACVAQERCGLARDFVVQALEQIKNGAANEAEDGLQLLKHANERCASLGDAWYYRSLFEHKLNQTAKANYSLSKAKMFGSEAMEQGLDPFVLVTGMPTATVTLGPVREKWALVIGISKFQDTHVQRLNYPSKDAKDFASLLNDPKVGRFKPENVHLLIDADATTRKIKMELNWLARNAKPDDLVVVFLASHGSPRSRDIAGVNYIITSDTEVGDPNKDPDSLFATALPMVDLSDIVRGRIQARRTAIFLDTCHSGAAAGRATTGSAFGDASASGEALDRIRQGVGRVIISSSGVTESSYENDEAQNGYFTYFLMKALRQSSGLDPINKIYDYVHIQVSQGVLTRFKLPQNPVLSLSDQSVDVVLGAKPAGGG
jgi:hypothetical protein